jgi:dihydroorotate dehydrogenase (NAD+) catalytic subunit
MMEPMAEPVELLPGHKHGLLLVSPVMAAAGAFGYVEADVRAMLPPGLGAVVTRTLTRRPQRPADTTGLRLAPVPRFAETPAGLVHRLHEGNVGFDAATRRGRHGGWAAGDIPVIVSIAGTPEDCADMAGHLDETPGVAGVELRLWTLLSDEVLDEAEAVVSAVRTVTSLPVLVKLSPAAPDLVSLACTCVDAGADVLVIGGPWPAQAPVAPYGDEEPWDGWLSGPALLPLVLPRVRQVAEAVAAPVIACGGAQGLADVRAYLHAGARAVQVGSAFLTYGVLRSA